jgi:hypothetical protein
MRATDARRRASRRARPWLALTFATSACASLDGLTRGDAGAGGVEAGGGDTSVPVDASTDATTAKDAAKDARRDAALHDAGGDRGLVPDVAAGDASACAEACPTGQVCQAGACVCPSGGLLCSGGCVDPAGDLGNCGACGVVCSGACQLGRCVVVIASNQAAPTRVIVDGAYAYWADYGAASGNGAIARVPLAGGAAETLAPSRLFPSAMAIDGTSLYWIEADADDENGKVLRMPLDGGTIDTLATSVAPLEIAIDARHVYWTTFDPGTSPYGTLLVAAKDGGATSTLASNQMGLSGLAIDGTRAYWGTSNGGGAVMSVPLDGGSATELAASASGAPVSVVVDPKRVYWTTVTDTVSGQTGVLEQAPLDGGAPVTLISDSTEVGAIAVDTTSLYWTDGTTGGSIFQRPLDGGATTTLGINQDQIFHLAVDPTSLYWVIGSGGYGGTIVKLSPK